MIMTELDEKREGSFLIPFLIGGLVGAGIALLLAPKSGKELRKDIADMTANTRDRVTDTIDKGKDMYREGITAVKTAVEAGKVAYVEEREKHRQAAV
jgi:gas vesicle protein